jgi:uncharacterized protein (TIGR02594 family)
MRATLSAYSPVSPSAKVSAKKRRMEGGLESARRGPDGKFLVRTLMEYHQGRVPYVTLAGNPKFYGRKYTLTDIPLLLENGKTVVLSDVPAIVHDTGSAFKKAAEGRFDLALGIDLSDALMNKNADLWKRYGIIITDGWPTGKKAVPQEPPAKDPEATPWVQKAKSYVGTREIRGPKHNPLVVALWSLGKVPLSVNDDETPWCAAFISAVLELAGIKSARTGWARSYLNWGQRIPGPAVGAIVVFSRGSGGHVGIVMGRDQNNNLMVLGGNQSDSVNIAPFARRRVLGYRWPPGYQKPDKTGMSTLPRYTSDGRVSRNEV